MQLIRTLRLNFVQALITFVVVMLLVSLVPTTASAQARQASGVTQQSKDAAWAKYEQQKKDPNTALLYEGLVPLLGNNYAGKTSEGYLPLAVSLTGLVVAFTASTSSSGCSGLGAYSQCHAGVSPAVPLGILTYLGGRVWGMIAAHNTAVDFNTDLQKKLGVYNQTASR